MNSEDQHFSKELQAAAGALQDGYGGFAPAKRRFRVRASFDDGEREHQVGGRGGCWGTTPLPVLLLSEKR